jgi:hypothetical protein
VPLNGSINVKVNGVPQFGNYTLDGRLLKFNDGHVPPVGSTITVNYRF